MDIRNAGPTHDSRTPPTTTPPLLSIFGANAKVEGKFEVEESIEVQCEIAGQMHVGGTLVIGDRGRVSADVATVDAVIRGSYSGNLKASGSVEIAASGRVNGTIESSELVIAKGAIFTGSVTHVEKKPAPEAKNAAGDGVRAPRSNDGERPLPGTPVKDLDARPVAANQGAHNRGLGL